LAYKDDDGVQDAEFRACRPKSQTDDDGVKDDAELKDEEGCNLCAEGIGDDDRIGVSRGIIRCELGVFLISSIHESLRMGPRAVQIHVVSMSVTVILRGSAAGVGRDEGFDVGFAHVANAVFRLDVALGGEVEEEGDQGGEEGEGWGPGVGRPASGHTYAGEGTNFAVGGVEETVGGGC